MFVFSEHVNLKKERLMCGIVGYTGSREASPILIGGLRRLEYRGYDSAGLALLGEDGDMQVYKAVGKVANLEDLIKDKNLSSGTGIAHTRWATHGAPSTINSHPHQSQSGRFAIVHNGIIENYAVIRKRLMGMGYTFRSETDTEVLVQLLEYMVTNRGITDTVEAVRATLKEVIGAYAICILDRTRPGEIILAKQSSPLVVGVGEGNSEFFVGSDASPIVEYTKEVIYLEDAQIARIVPGQPISITTIENRCVQPHVQHLEMSIGSLEKGGYDHFMLKEIFEQPQVLRDCMRGRVLPSRHSIVLSALSSHSEVLTHAGRFIIISCGTSWHAGLIGKQLIENFCDTPVEVEYASEFRYRNPVIRKDDVVIAISQSGETADTLAAMQLAKEKGAFLFGIVNVIGSSIARTATTGIYTHVGPEVGVASTKAFTGQLTVLSMFALALGHLKGTITDGFYHEAVDELYHIPDKMEKVLEEDARIADMAKQFTYARNFLYLGRGYNYPLAMEGALKLKEISYIHAEGYPAAEMKHGPIALIDADMPVVFVATQRHIYDKAISNIQEVKSRKGKVYAIVFEGDENVSKVADFAIKVPVTSDFLSPIVSTVPLQLLAYHVAVNKGLNVDMPRNLAKSVTVE